MNYSRTQIPSKEFLINSRVNCSSLVIADINNDGCNEVIAGTNSGTVHVFYEDGTVKTFEVFPQRPTHTPFISALCYGLAPVHTPSDPAHRLLIVVSGDGHLALVRLCGGDSSWSPCVVLAQQLPANVIFVRLCDVDRDSRDEMVCALSDRVIRVYRYVQRAESGATLLAMCKCELMLQIGSVCVCVDGCSLLLTQLGTCVLHVTYNVPDIAAHLEDGSGGRNHSQQQQLSLFLHDISPETKLAKCDVSCEVVALGERNDRSVKYALATSDGHVLMVCAGVTLWHVTLRACLFSLHALSCRTRLVVSSWNGHTYFIDVGAAHQYSCLALKECLFAFSVAECGPATQGAACVTLAAVCETNRLIMYARLRVLTRFARLRPSLEGVQLSPQLVERLLYKHTGNGSSRALTP